MIVLSQWHRDAVDCQIKMAGKTARASATVNLLGVTIDQLLHFGATAGDSEDAPGPG